MILIRIMFVYSRLCVDSFTHCKATKYINKELTLTLREGDMSDLDFTKIGVCVTLGIFD